MMVVMDYMLGETRIIFHDDAYKDKTQKDIDEILERVKEINTRIYIRKQIEEAKAREKAKEE